MKPDPLTIECIETSIGAEYRIVDNTGTIYATSYNLAVAKICCIALNKQYPAG